MYWSNDPHDHKTPHYHYLHWDNFVREFKEQFHDPTIKEVYEKRMGELKMAGDVATVYFQKLKREAKLARQPLSPTLGSVSCEHTMTGKTASSSSMRSDNARPSTTKPMASKPATTDSPRGTRNKLPPPVATRMLQVA